MHIYVFGLLPEFLYINLIGFSECKKWKHTVQRPKNMKICQFVWKVQASNRQTMEQVLIILKM